MKLFFNIAFLVCAFAGTTLSVRAQAPAPPPTSAYQPLSNEDLDQLLGPIALYPDPLIAEILPASTFPTQIVLAGRYVNGGGDPNQLGQQPWDPSVQAVARYPNVLKWMDDNLDDTTELGQAFLNQQQAVMASIQRLRAKASSLGNLQTTPQQVVANDGGDIEIDPANDQELYVPNYDPDEVYDDEAEGSPFITFGIGFPIGLWLDDDCDWDNGDIIVWDQGNPRPSNWWRQSRGQRNTGHTTTWRASNHANTALTSRGNRNWSSSAPTSATVKTEVARQTSQSNERAARASRTASSSAGNGANSAFTGGESTHQASRANNHTTGASSNASAAVGHTNSLSHTETSSAFTGTHSDHGQQSSGAGSHSASVSHSSPSSGHSSGGGSHSSGGDSSHSSGGGSSHSSGGGHSSGGSHSSGGGGSNNKK